MGQSLFPLRPVLLSSGEYALPSESSGKVLTSDSNGQLTWSSLPQGKPEPVACAFCGRDRTGDGRATCPGCAGSEFKKIVPKTDRAKIEQWRERMEGAIPRKKWYTESEMRENQLQGPRERKAAAAKRYQERQWWMP